MEALGVVARRHHQCCTVSGPTPKHSSRSGTVATRRASILRVELGEFTVERFDPMRQ